MAKENTTIEVYAELEEFEASKYANFGWELESTKHVERDGEDMVVLTFSRDTEMQNYEKVDELYQKFLIINQETFRVTQQELALGEAPQKLEFNPAACLLILLAIPGMIALIIYIINFSKKSKQRDKEIEAYNKAYNEIHKKVKECNRELIETMVESSKLF